MSDFLKDIEMITQKATIASKQKSWFEGYFKRQFKRCTNGKAVDFA